MTYNCIIVTFHNKQRTNKPRYVWRLMDLIILVKTSISAQKLLWRFLHIVEEQVYIKDATESWNTTSCIHWYVLCFVCSYLTIYRSFYRVNCRLWDDHRVGWWQKVEQNSYMNLIMHSTKHLMHIPQLMSCSYYLQVTWPSHQYYTSERRLHHFLCL